MSDLDDMDCFLLVKERDVIHKHRKIDIEDSGICCNTFLDVLKNGGSFQLMDSSSYGKCFLVVMANNMAWPKVDYCPFCGTRITLEIRRL